MNKGDVLDYLSELKDKKPKEFVNREIKVDLSKNYILSLYGPRRSGKSFFLRNLIDDETLYLDFDDIRLQGLEGKDVLRIVELFNEIFGKTPKKILLDEIQNVKNWPNLVRTLFDRVEYKIAITGSSSRFLSREIHTSLRGRTLSYLFLPFSFREYLIAKGERNLMEDRVLSSYKRAKIKKILREYIKFGSLPEVLFIPDKEKYLSEYVDLITYKDFIDRYDLRNFSFVKFLITHLIRSSPNEISPRSIYNKAKGVGIRVSKDKVYEITSLIQDTCFFFFTTRISSKPHIKESWPKKVYLADTGVKFLIREEYDRALEILTFLELLRIKNTLPTINIYYYRDKDKEADFVVCKKDKVLAVIQVTYELTSDNYRREVSNLLKIGKLLKSRNKLVITWDTEGEEKGVSILPAYEILRKNYLLNLLSNKIKK